MSQNKGGALSSDNEATQYFPGILWNKAGDLSVFTRAASCWLTRM